MPKEITPAQRSMEDIVSAMEQVAARHTAGEISFSAAVAEMEKLDREYTAALLSQLGEL